MDSQKIAAVLATLIGLIVSAVVFIYTPKNGADSVKQQAEKQQVELPKAPAAPPVRGPVVRDITPQQ
jgi:hypothetical protein